MQNDCLTLLEYERIAIRYLAKNLPAAKKNPDHINRVLEYMLRSDISYTHGIGTLKGRRMTYAKFATQHIRAALKRRKKGSTYSLDQVVGGEKSRESSSGEALTYNELSPSEMVELNELRDFILSPTLTSLESCSIVEHYLEKISIKDIAAKFGVTRQSVYLAIARGLEKVRKLYGEEG